MGFTYGSVPENGCYGTAPVVDDRAHDMLSRPPVNSWAVRCQDMSDYMAKYYRHRRLTKGLTLREVAGIIGFRNLKNGIRCLRTFERHGSIRDNVLVRLTEALEITYRDLFPVLAEQVRREETRKPFRPYLIVRYQAGVHGRMPLPKEIETPDEAERYACDYARERGMRVCLLLSPKKCMWISDGGEVNRREEARLGQSALPCVTLWTFLMASGNIVPRPPSPSSGQGSCRQPPPTTGSGENNKRRDELSRS